VTKGEEKNEEINKETKRIPRSDEDIFLYLRLDGACILWEEGGDTMKAVKVRVPDRHFDRLCNLVRDGVFPSISAAVRHATGNLLTEERRFGHLS